jgi:hypothetical protein
MSGFTNASSLSSTVPGAYLSPLQDVTQYSATADTGSVFTGEGFTSTFTGLTGTTLTSLIGASLAVTAAVGGGALSFFGTRTVTVNTSGGIAVLSYTGTTATTYTGIAIVSGTGSWTLTNGTIVYDQPNIIPDVYLGASLTRGDGSKFGTNDWATLLNNTENNLAGLPQQASGFVTPVYSDSIYGGLQWATGVGSGAAASNLGSPIVAPNAAVPSALAAYASSLLVTTAATTPGDTRTFRRVILFYLKQTNGDSVTFATTGVVRSSGTLTTTGSGLACWDSGDLGYAGAGTGFTATWSSGGGAGVVLVGALYIQSAGTNGTININISKGGTSTADYAGVTSGYSAFLTFLANIGMAARRVFTGDQVGNDSLYNSVVGTTPSSAATNIRTTITAIQAASPKTSVVWFFPYNVGTASVPGVGNSQWPSWQLAAQNASITAGATWVDGYSRFGNLAYGGDTYGLTCDNLHMGIPPAVVSSGGGGIPSFSGRNGQQALSELFFDKLYYSKNFGLSGISQTGVAADGSIVQKIGQGTSFGSPFNLLGFYQSATDTNPKIVITSSASSSFSVTGIYLGAGGSTALDSGIIRTTANKLATVTSVAASTAGTGIIQTGIDTSKTATASTQVFTNGTAAQLVTPTVEDALVYLTVTTAGTAFTLAIGPTSAVAVPIVASVAVAVGETFTVRLPAGWYLKWAATTATVATANIVSC